ncbi:MAG: 3-oxoacyl-ACP reductase [Chloroflexi bacterium RBG_16_56_11]|nr:MAG: 3-oxoacyl-ACP reductase [Chloroflexi bacterium RBG_16_56_11]
MKEFKGKVAVITGAASGIGLGLAERCAKEGMKVVLAGINEDTLKKTEKDIKKTGATTLVVKTDVSKADDVEALAKKTLDTFGAVHLLFNNAGVGAGATVWGSTLADWEWVLSVNLWGVIYGIHFFVPTMLKQDTECHIVNTASGAGLITMTNNGPYAVSKHGVVALSETLYRELAMIGNKNIGVSVLCPGIINTKILECARNRPAELQNAPGEEAMDVTDPKVQEMMQSMKQTFANGMPPQRVADIVFNAIKEKNFYMLPNMEAAIPALRARMEDILQERNPTTILMT